jgi:hypothetical protein
MNSQKSILIQLLKIHFNIILPYSHRPSCFPIRNLFNITFTPMYATFLTHLPLFFDIPESEKQYKLENPHYASFPSNFLCFYTKHYSHHSILKQNQLINGKKHSPFLKFAFYVIHVMHPYFNQQNGLIKKQYNRSQTTFLITYCLLCFSPKVPSSKVLLKVKDLCPTPTSGVSRPHFHHYN